MRFEIGFHEEVFFKALLRVFPITFQFLEGFPKLQVIENFLWFFMGFCGFYGVSMIFYWFFGGCS